MFNVKVIGGDKVYATNPTSATEGEGVAIIKASGGRLFELRCVNTTAADVWLQVFNATAAPAAEDKPIAVGRIPGNWEGSLPWVTGLPMGLGIVAAVSPEGSPFFYDATHAAATDFFFTANYN